jgi:hypothetical protein
MLGDSKLQVNHLFISWKNLLTVFFSSVWLGLFTVMRVSSTNKTILALSFIDFGRSLI